MKIQTLDDKPISPEDIEKIINGSFDDYRESPSDSIVVRLSDQRVNQLPVGIQAWQNYISSDDKNDYDLAASTILDPVFYATGKIHNPDDTMLSSKYSFQDFFGGPISKEGFPTIYTTKKNLQRIDTGNVEELLQKQANSFFGDYDSILSATNRVAKKFGKEISSYALQTRGKMLDIRDHLAEDASINGPLANKIYAAFDEIVESKHFKDDFTKSPMYQPLMTELAQLSNLAKK